LNALSEPNNGTRSRNLVLFSHPGCPPFAQQAARGLLESGLLSAYSTTFSYDRDSTLGKAMKAGMSLASPDAERELVRREITEVPADRIIRHPISEILRTIASKAPTGPIVADRIWDKAERWFDRTVAQKDLNGERAVYCYEYAALSTFEKQKARGGLCVYDLPIAHHKLTAELLDPEMEQFPEALTNYESHLRRLATKRNERKDRELALADHVLVASSFTKSSLMRIGFPEAKVSVVPYGAPPVVATTIKRKTGPFVFLSAGTQSVRKGVHYTLEAWKRMKPRGSAELWLVGQMLLPERLLSGLPGKVVSRPSVPKAELSDIYSRADALVFPSLVEGFGMVITEAMAHGLPVITTSHTAAPELITSGTDGFIVPIRDVDALATTMQWCIDNREVLQEMGVNAANKASRWQWSDYRSGVGARVKTLLAEHN
jgi:glycosyltransferase involved in cell wall biosynthesis